MTIVKFYISAILQSMKRLLATSVLLGYILLVPFCLFGGAVSDHGGTGNMGNSHVHNAQNGGMPVGCGHASGADAADDAAQHVSMYLSLTQTPLTALSLLVTILALQFLVVLAVSNNWFRTPFLQTSSLHVCRTEEPHVSIRQKILAWLSLFEASPNFA